MIIKVTPIHTKVVDEVIAYFGSAEKARAALGYESVMSIYTVRRRGLPKRRLLDIHEMTGISLDRLKKGVKPKVVEGAKRAA